MESVKTKLHALIDAADEQQAERFYLLLQQDEADVHLLPEEVMLAKERSQAYKSGQMTGLSLAEVQKRLEAYR